MGVRDLAVETGLGAMLKQWILAAIVLASGSVARAESGGGYSYPVGLDANGDNFLALRSRPTTLEGVRLRKLGPGTLFSVIGRQGAWYNVRLLDGESGWVYSRYVGCCARGPQGPAPAVAQSMQVVVQSGEAEAARLRGQVEQLTALVRASQEKQEQRDREAEAARQAAARAEAERPPVADEDALAGLSARFEQAAANRASYLTPTKPDDQDLGRTARAASEHFPKVPFYIPGTRESGRFWVEPRVGDTGQLSYDMVFVDPRASVDQKRATIDLTPEQLDRMKLAIAKISLWSDIAHRNEVRRHYRKRVDCFPDASCPRDGDKIDGKSSTEIVFFVNEDGSTGGRIQRNKGRYDEGYNVSVKSARLLASYLGYVQSRGERDYAAGTRTAADLDVMFK
ncbi:SH3 domain-containing protein [Methylobacterium variabile]|uniref:SH3 domain-containing protein n=1 Tax=Methylobacterium variabile TaxID=298794 RepID=UPI001FD79709|nr:SH3 domain-containing protein [Methylobacterium variabile]